MNDEERRLIAIEAAIEADMGFFIDEDGNRDTNPAILVEAAKVIENYLAGKPQEWEEVESTDKTRKDN